MNALTPSAEWLVEEQYRFLAPDRYHAAYQPHRIQPIEGVVYHYTASTKKDPARNWLTAKDDAFVSAHFLIDRDGTIEQLAPLTDRTFHAGGSRFLGRGAVNERTIGIEIVNVGPLVGYGGYFWTVDGAGNRARKFQGSMVSAKSPSHPYTIWEAYSVPAMEAVCRLTRVLTELFPSLLADRNGTRYPRLVGHEEIDPKRKMDPGPAFPWELVWAAAEGTG